LFILILSLSFVLTGCSTKYVCYDGTEQKKSIDCPTIEVSSVAELDAGKYVDNYGVAVAQAKRQSYTRVNMYNKDASWFANVLFTDQTTGGINKVLLKIDGKTGDVSCITGCEYFNPVVPVVTPPEPVPEIPVEVPAEVPTENTTV
jgi:hypothetical protein